MNLERESIKAQLCIEGFVVMYVGNLEPYQGIDLLLQSFAMVLGQREGVHLVIIGGDVEMINHYQKRTKHLGIENEVHLLGPQPLELLPSFLSQADILVSARTKGNNTPMKIYPYLQSGKPVVATNLPTHTQVLDSKVAMLAEPNPISFSEAMLRLIDDINVRNSLGLAGKRLAEEHFSYARFRTQLDEFLDWLEKEIARERSSRSRASHEA